MTCLRRPTAPWVAVLAAAMAVLAAATPQREREQCQLLGKVPLRRRVPSDDGIPPPLCDWPACATGHLPGTLLVPLSQHTEGTPRRP